MIEEWERDLRESWCGPLGARNTQKVHFFLLRNVFSVMRTRGCLFFILIDGRCVIDSFCGELHGLVWQELVLGRFSRIEHSWWVPVRPLLGILSTVIFWKGGTGKVAKGGLHQNICNFMSYGPLEVRAFVFSIFFSSGNGGYGWCPFLGFQWEWAFQNSFVSMCILLRTTMHIYKYIYILIPCYT